MTENIRVPSRPWSFLLAASGIVIFTVLGTISMLTWAGWLSIPPVDPQAMVHDMGAHVMPFDLSQKTHIFEMTESGGIQQVIADDLNDKEQIALVQQHIQHEALLFASGDFSDPISLHGDERPGAQELAAGAAQVKIEYAALPNGAQITFTTEDLHLVTAIHRCFGAQLSDHGSDATYR